MGRASREAGGGIAGGLINQRGPQEFICWFFGAGIQNVVTN